jgi:hypothetical protein
MTGSKPASKIFSAISSRAEAVSLITATLLIGLSFIVSNISFPFRAKRRFALNLMALGLQVLNLNHNFHNLRINRITPKILNIYSENSKILKIIYFITKKAVQDGV